jgi:ABC-type sugar transport system permease subunit
MASPAINEALLGAMHALMGGVTNVPPEMTETTGVDTMMVLRLLTNYGLPLAVAQYVADAIVSLFDIIRASGVQIIIFLAALQSVPGSLYEVAKIEGATAYETFWKITLPMVSPLILTNMIYTIIDSFSRSDIIVLSYNMAFTTLNFGLSSAMSLISSISICIVLLLSGWLVSRKVFYHV